MIEGTFLAIEHMSERKGGHGGTVINVASFGGGLETSKTILFLNTQNKTVGFELMLNQKTLKQQNTS